MRNPRPAVHPKLRREIVTTLRRLHARREPLNLEAVRRRHPGLLAAVFAARPFWGWRRALLDAGIAYDQINVELEDGVPCRLCAGGEHFAILTGHLRGVHGLSPAEYRQEFPGAEIVSESVRALHARRRRPVALAHWEPLWSDEYVLDRLQAHREQGAPLNSFWAGTHDKGLLNHAIRCFGGWDAALRRVGLDPGKVRRNAPARPILTAAEVIAALQARRREGQALNSATVEGEDVRLANAARRRFGTYVAALRAAGIAAREVRRRPTVYAPAQIGRLLAEVRRVAVLPGAERAEAWQSLRRRRDRLVANAGRFGNWTKVFAAAGVERTLFISGRRYPDEESTLAALRARLAAGLSVKAGAVWKEERTLYRAVGEHLGGFAAVYPLLGLSMPASARARTRRYEGPEAVIKELRRRAEAGEPLGTNEGVRVGPLADPTLWRAARLHFGTWREALAAAGLPALWPAHMRSRATTAKG